MLALLLFLLNKSELNILYLLIIFLLGMLSIKVLRDDMLKYFSVRKWGTAFHLNHLFRS